MGRPKKELKKIHRKKIKKARDKIKAVKSGQAGSETLTAKAKHFLKKGKKKKSALS